MGKLNVPKGSHVVNPLVSTSDARKLIEFLELVFDAREDKNALAIDEADDKVFNSSVTIGDTPINIFDRKDGWKHMPALLQVYVSELDKKLGIAKNNGAEIVTSATDFYGGKLARFIDPQGNLWWLFELEEYDESDWTAEDLEDDDAA